MLYGFYMSEEVGNSTDSSMAARLIAALTILVCLIVALVGFGRVNVCDEQLSQAGDVVEVCRHLQATDPPVIAVGLIILVSLGVFFNEISGFGFTLKRDVREARETAHTAKTTAANAVASANKAERATAEVERVVSELRRRLYSAGDRVNKEESDLSRDEIEARARHFDKYQAYMDSLTDAERFQAQRDNTLLYLSEFGLAVSDIKKYLTRLDLYSGTMDDEFTPDLAKAIETFQRTHDLRHVDGMVGELTLKQMEYQLRREDVQNE